MGLREPLHQAVAGEKMIHKAKANLGFYSLENDLTTAFWMI